jgi:CheY-like chemotaxis protein
MSNPLRVLILEDDEADAALTLHALERGDFNVTESIRVETEAGLKAQLEEQKWDIVLSDYRMPRFSAPEALAVVQRHMAETGQDLPFIVISGTIGEEAAVAMMKAGAADYLLKGSLKRLAPAVAREIREAEGRRERRRAEEALRDAEIRQRAFVGDVLHSVTQGRLRLCNTEEDLPPPLSPMDEPIELSAASLRRLRGNIRLAAEYQGLSFERGHDLLTASGEVAMNAVVHGQNGRARVHSGEGTVQVRVEDQGKGIDMQRLPRATLERGYSTAGTLGHGFYLVLATVDRTWLLTGKNGTTVVVEQDRTPAEPSWLSGLTGP